MILLLELDHNRLDFFENSSLIEMIFSLCESFFFLHFSLFKHQTKDLEKCIKPTVLPFFFYSFLRPKTKIQKIAKGLREEGLLLD